MHPEFLSLSLFMFVTICSPGPNNVVASHSGFNHGIKKSIPLMLGVIFGFTTMLAVVNFGLINIFNIYPIIQEILIGTGTIFLQSQGLVRLKKEQIEDYEWWKQQRGKNSETAWPRYMLFSLFARKHLRTKADGKLEKWQSEIRAI